MSLLSPRTGRPKVDNPKSAGIKVRFDEETYKALGDYCEKHQVSKAEAIREGLRLLLSADK